ncbi:Retrovirus Pol polyprotein [Schistosoma japonicum]|uniref:Retrovirus-related Pol polyprotein n=1 Tax=Schistosoma japonicum TaxID=6182 RepID=C1LLE7_SCHJA|nr:Retrovirus Pol polyprotein [Schistosoma japonicum]CAX75521.1 Retrovirus-related Pol polyprotein [Schistosoma japonicum]CAX75523.1 Retrovirus-related Pol polyprotein [Schistosoma japonicum]CAX75524.1 Retrovirus-related Pol polyprotein [Schistosoma japonicum]CAX75525.1 Retrovirus-related Pol polyprotein [Schistosoma japonicum]
MTFVTSSGHIVDRQPWGIRYLKQLLLNFFNLICLFIQTLLPLDLFRPKASNQRSSWDGRPPRPPGRRFGGFGGCGGAPGAPPMGGGG